MKILTRLTKRQFLPTLKSQFLPTSKDIESDELKDLSKKLKGDSEKATLTNILEWQDRNIQFWWERWPFDLLLKILIPFNSFSILIITMLLLSPLPPYYFKFQVFIIFVLGFFLMCGLSNIVLKLFYLFLASPFVYLFTNLALGNPLQVQSIVAIAFCNGTIAIAIIAYLLSRYNGLLREKPIKEKIPKFIEVVNDTFRLSLPVDKILEYKLAVCRDYAKLTASLLFNMYPDSELYFIRILWHVAACIKIKNKIYVLDRRLPILTIDNWLIKWNKKKADIYTLKIERDSEGKPIDVKLKKSKTIPQKSILDVPKIDTEKLTEEIAKMLGITQSSNKDELDFEISLSNYAIYYEDDEIIKYSLIRAVENRLKNELCGNMNKILKVNISQNKRDLIISVCLKTPKNTKSPLQKDAP